MNKLKLFLTSLMFMGLLLIPVSADAADPLASVCSQTPDAAVCADRNQTPGANRIYGKDGIITTATQILAIVTGVAAVIVIIIAGLQYVLSTGDPAKINKAKDMILYAVAGLVVAALAQSIVVFVLSEL